MLFSAVPQAQDAFEDTIGASEWRMLQVLKGILQMVLRITIDETLLKSEAFIERAKQYAFLGITETMLGDFNVVLVKSLHTVLGDAFPMLFVRAWY
jgi:hypothetical protein